MRMPRRIKVGGLVSSFVVLLTISGAGQPVIPTPWLPIPPFPTIVLRTPLPSPAGESPTAAPESTAMPTPTAPPDDAVPSATPIEHPVEPSPTAASGPRGLPDAWEPNNSRLEARDIAVGETISGLTFVCPDESGCADNDFFRIPVKGGTCYQIQTTDLAAGLDTNIIVYGPDSDDPLAGNDDITPNAFRSGLDVCIPIDWQPTSLIILVGNVGNIAPPTPADERTYALQTAVTEPKRPETPVEPSPEPPPPVAPAPAPPSNPAPVNPAPVNPAPPPAPQPTPAPSAAPESGSTAPAESGASATARVSRITNGPKGPARVRVQETTLRVGPGTRTEAIVPLLNGTGVLLLGTSEGAWAYVQPVVSVIPGWVYAPDLTPLEGTIEGAESFEVTESVTATAVVSDTTALAPSPSARASASDAESESDLAIEPLPDALDPVAEPLPRLPLEITVAIIEAPSATDGDRRSPSRTPIPEHYVGGIRVQLVTAFGDILVEAETVPNQPLRFTPDVPSGTALFVQVPELSLREEVALRDAENGQTTVTIEVPESELAWPETGGME